MEKRDFAKKFIAGIFLISGIILLSAVILSLGKDKGFTQKKFQIVVLYRDVGGLLDGAPVRLAGVNVGTVSKVSFLKEIVAGCRVGVVINIFEKYRTQLNKGARFFIRTEGILGEKLIEIAVLESGKALDLNKPIIGEDSKDVQYLAEAFAAAAESFTHTSEELSQIDMQKLSEVVGETAQSLLQTSQGISKLLEELQYMTKKSKRLMDRVEQRIIDGNLFKVF
ncbi:hypothetical protein MNBD_UNCLBAC01-1642 [hydrothermal vent metagenome]|uniref:Mce/MlaD domain-containing protein n=1 Tax=hydrothermal vent metagenome TaxID=652676 RepID=A0A3B1D435_9ZZZZ